MLLQGLSEDRQLSVGFEAAEGLFGFHEPSSGPAQGHFGVTPALDVALDQADGAQCVLDDVGAGERASEFSGQAETGDGEDLVQALEDRARDPGRVLLQAPGEIADETLGLLRIVQLPGLAQRLLDAGLEVLGQAFGDVAALVDLAALDQGRGSEGLSDRLGERLGAVDDEEPGDLGIEPPVDQVVDQGLDGGAVLRGPSAIARTCFSPWPSTPIAATRT